MKKSNNYNLFSNLEQDFALNNTITVQSKLSLFEEQDFILNKIMEHLTHCTIIYFNLLTNDKKIKKFIDQNAILIEKNKTDKNTKEVSLVKEKESLKVAFCRIYQISSRQFNSIEVFVKGLIQSNKSLMDIHLISLNDQLESKNKKLNKLIQKVELIKFSDAFKNNDEKILENFNKQRNLIFKIKQDIQKKESSIRKLEYKIKNNHISVCFGNTKILKRLSSLFNDSNYDNGKFKNISHSVRKNYQKEYRKLWENSRFNQFTLVGSKDENNGNNSCVLSKLNENSYSIRISIPEFVINQLSLKCKYLTIDNISFKHNEKEILNAFSLNNERKIKEQEYNQKLKDKDVSLYDKENKIIKKAEYLKDYGTSLTFRFKKDTSNDPKDFKHDWRVMLSMDETKVEKAITSKANGVISIDMNVDHYALADINKNLDLVKAFKINFGFSDKSKNASHTLRNESILLAAKQVIEYSLKTKKPIVIENLDFKKKKALLKEEENTYNIKADKKRNRMLTSFAYSKMVVYIKQLAYRNGIAVYEVNPAYTSQIGFIKYAKKHGISKHMAAAYVIGRRSYGIEELFAESEQVIVKNQVKTLSVQVDREKCSNYYMYCNRNLKGFQKRLVVEDRGKKEKKPSFCQIAKPLGISIFPPNS